MVELKPVNEEVPEVPKKGEKPWNYKGNETHPLYNIWRQMKQRCYNPRADWFHRYGGRGITVCDEWRGDFQAFANYITSTLGPRPVGTTLDRIDNDGNYEPGNVRWATAKEQSETSTHVMPNNVGEANSQARLTSSDIPIIFAIKGLGFTNTEIGKMFGVHRTTIQNVLCGKRWSHAMRRNLA